MASGGGIGISNTYGAMESNSTGQIKVAAMIDGIDPNAVAKEIVAVKMQQSQIYEDKITLNDGKMPIIEEIRKRVATLNESVKKLTNDLRANYIGNDANTPNALNAKLARSTQSVNDNAITLTIEPIAKTTETDHTIKITQKAAADRITCSFNFKTPNTPVSFSGNLVVNNQTIKITENESTLNTIISAINSTAEISNVTASLLEISSTAGYVLILEGTKLAESINFMGAAGTDSALQGTNGLQLPTENTDPASILDTIDHVVSAYTNTSKDAPVGFSGNLVINGKTITISNSSTLTSIEKAINNVREETNVNASLFSPDGGATFQLVLDGTQIGVPINFLGLTTSSTLTGSNGLQLPATNTAASDLIGKTDHIVSNYAVSDAAKALNLSGNILINNQLIKVTTTSSLNSIRDDINALSKNTKVTASVISFDSNETFQLVIDGTQIGVPIDFIGTTTSDSLRGDAGLKLSTVNTDSDSLIAKLSINGRDIERQSNIISNAILGVKITINGESTTPTKFSIENDKDVAFKAIKEFVENYNLVIDAINEQKKLKPDEKTPDLEASVLYGEEVISKLEYLLSTIVRASPIGLKDGEYRCLSDIGIELNAYDSDSKTSTLNGKLNLNLQVLQEKILNGDFDKLIRLFGNHTQSTDQKFMTFAMPRELNPAIANKPITLTYAHAGVTSTDELFSTNFRVPEPTQILNPSISGQSVSLEYIQEEDGTYLARIIGRDLKDKEGKAITDGSILTVNASITDNVFTFPKDSLFAGLVIDFIGTTLPSFGSPIETTLTLPQFKATLSMDGKEDVVISNVQHDLITAPKGSIYEGLKIGYLTMGKYAPLSMNQSMKTTLTLTQGIAVDFSHLLSSATTKYNPAIKGSSMNLFDVAIQELLEENKSNVMRIDDISDEAERMRHRFEPMIGRLYTASHKAKSIAQMLEAELASHYG